MKIRMEMELSAKERLELLLKPNWNNEDISKYFGIKSPATIIQKKRQAQKLYGNNSKEGIKLVSTEAILKLFGTDVETETRRIRLLMDCGV